MKLPDRLVWMLSRRYATARNTPGFWAHWDTYADDRCIFSRYNKLYKGSILGNVLLGHFTYIAGARTGNCSYGAFCSIGPEAIIGGLGRHPSRWLTTHPAFFSTLAQAGLTFSDFDAFEETSSTIVGNDVWIGARALVLDGITIGDGAIVGAGALVNRDVEPYAVVGGVPARLIRYRFDQEVISELLSWKWWELPDETLKQIASYFTGQDYWTLDDIKRLREKAHSLPPMRVPAGEYVSPHRILGGSNWPR